MDDKLVFLSTTKPLSDHLPLPLKGNNLEYIHGIVTDGGDHSDDQRIATGSIYVQQMQLAETTW